MRSPAHLNRRLWLYSVAVVLARLRCLIRERESLMTESAVIEELADDRRGRLRVLRVGLVCADDRLNGRRGDLSASAAKSVARRTGAGMKPRHQRIVLVVLGLCGVATAVGLALSTFNENLTFFFSPSQVVSGEAPVARNFRIGGLVEDGSMRRGATD